MKKNENGKVVNGPMMTKLSMNNGKNDMAFNYPK